MKLYSRLMMIAIMSLAIISCGDDDPEITNKDLTLNLTGLEDLGADFAYEGWIIVDGAAVSTGVFNVDASGNLDQTTFSVEQTSLDNATTFVLTIEPSPDTDPAPTDVHILAGDFSGSNATVSVDHEAALGTDFTASTGKYILATPTDGEMNNEKSGVWFLDLASGMPEAGLNLPILPTGWAYEGWAVIDGTPVTTGTFTDFASADADAKYSGTMGGPAYPGEDFIQNAPAGLSFPTDLAGTTVVISVEPSPDNSPAPFVLKPLVAPVDSDALDHVTYDMNNNADATNPGGAVSRN
jgi:hypothetical protein